MALDWRVVFVDVVAVLGEPLDLDIRMTAFREKTEPHLPTSAPISLVELDLEAQSLEAVFVAVGPGLLRARMPPDGVILREHQFEMGPKKTWCPTVMCFRLRRPSGLTSSRTFSLPNIKWARPRCWPSPRF